MPRGQQDRRVRSGAGVLPLEGTHPVQFLLMPRIYLMALFVVELRKLLALMPV